MEYVSFGCRCLIAFVFCWSAASKARSRTEMQGFVLATRKLLTASVGVRLAQYLNITYVSTGVVTVEASIAVLAWIPALAIVGMGLSLVLLTIFSLAISASIRHGESATCRCFGRATQVPLGAPHLVRNISLGAAALVGMASAVTDQNEAPIAGLAIAAVAALLLTFIVARLDDLIDLFIPATVSSGHEPNWEKS